MSTHAVLVTVPGNLSSDGVEICVRHEEWGVEVDARPAGTSQTWTPIQLVGGRFEVRDR